MAAWSLSLLKIPTSHKVRLGATAESPSRYLSSASLAAVNDVLERPHGIRSEYANTSGEKQHNGHPATETKVSVKSFK